MSGILFLNRESINRKIIAKIPHAKPKITPASVMALNGFGSLRISWITKVMTDVMSQLVATCGTPDHSPPPLTPLGGSRISWTLRDGHTLGRTPALPWGIGENPQREPPRGRVSIGV